METTISVAIPQGYWGIVKRWLNRVARAPELLEPPLPSVKVLEDGSIVYTTASGHGAYTLSYCREELLITFEGRRNSFRSGTPFLGFRWDGDLLNNEQITVILKDVNPFAPEISFLGIVLSYGTSKPEAPFYKVPPEWIHVPAQTS
jgi:hypothetical protein